MSTNVNSPTFEDTTLDYTTNLISSTSPTIDSKSTTNYKAITTISGVNCAGIFIDMNLINEILIYG